MGYRRKANLMGYAFIPGSLWYEMVKNDGMYTSCYCFCSNRAAFWSFLLQSPSLLKFLEKRFRGLESLCWMVGNRFEEPTPHLTWLYTHLALVGYHLSSGQMEPIPGPLNLPLIRIQTVLTLRTRTMIIMIMVIVVKYEIDRRVKWGRLGKWNHKCQIYKTLIRIEEDESLRSMHV